MPLFRGLIFNTLFYAWTVLLGLFLLPWLLLPWQAVAAYARFWVRTTFWMLRHTVGLRYQVNRPAAIPEGPVIYAFKHQSAWDTLALSLLVPDGAVVLKRELTHIPLFGWGLKRAGHISVDRAGHAGALRRVIAQAQERISQGRPIIIFPEGTRTAPGQRHPYQPGVAALYAALNLPVVPVALNSGLFWPRRSLRLWPGVITVEFLPPIPPGVDRKAFMAELEHVIEDASDRLHIHALRPRK